ncbi:MAG: cytochrome c1 [Rhodobacteraceae bacterium]|nr:cytochrome c1 [Paracoccaceae bacterium]
MKNSILSALVAFGLGLGGTSALASGGESHIEDFAFSFEGPFGKYDQNQLQRGLQVYTEVCAACHGLRLIAFRTLGDPGGLGYSEDEVKAYAATYDIYNAEKDEDLPGTPADHFPANDGVGAPDLSVMAKARAGFHGPAGLGINQFFRGMGGAEYIASVLSGYDGHDKEESGATLYSNTAFPGGWLSMGPPLEDGLVEYADGHKNDVHHMAEDVSAFLMWAAEPKMMARKQAGLTAFLLLTLLGAMLYLTNKKLWAPIKRKD